MTVSPLLFALLVPGILAVAPGRVELDDEPELGLAVGQAHPDFALPALDGGAGRLSDWRGRRVLLFHFASW